MPLDHARFASFDSVDPEDLHSFRLLTGIARTVRKGTHLRHEGSPNPDVFRLRSGWLICSVGTSTGGRQITKINLPGDLVGLPSLACTQAVESIQAVTDAEIETVPLDAFTRIFRDHPRMAAMLLLWALEERQHLMNRMTLIGTMKGARRVAALLLQLYRRVKIGEPSMELSFAVPLTQQQVADCTGMSIVHANTSLKSLRTRGIASWHNGVVTIHDLDELEAFANLAPEQKRTTRWISAITRGSSR